MRCGRSVRMLLLTIDFGEVEEDGAPAHDFGEELEEEECKEDGDVDEMTVKPRWFTGWMARD